MADVLELDAVALVRDGTALLEDLSWRVAEGERWVVLGANGAGKTTLLQLAAARMHPSRGTVRVLGEQLGRTDISELRPRIGLASAALADRLPPGERVLDVVLTAAYAVVGRWRERYEGEDLERAAGLLAAFGVGHLADRTFGTLSEGERKRVQLARAMMPDPELMLLDEPAAGLDLGGRERLVRDLALLAAEPMSPVMVLVTHHVEEIPPGFTHALVLRGGRTVACGPAAEVLTEVNLSTAFDVPLRVHHAMQRWYATLRTDG
jgi:iron complex transport system ATP-binding protein